MLTLFKAVKLKSVRTYSKLFLSFALTISFLTPNFARAYELPEHFYASYIQARCVGMAHKDALVYAVSAQKIDDKFLTSPMWTDLARLIWHFSGSPRVSDSNPHGTASLIDTVKRAAIRLARLDKKLQQLEAVATKDHAIPHYLVSRAMETKDPIALGFAGHTRQDNGGAHVGHSSGVGHPIHGHDVDNTASRPDIWEETVDMTFESLVQAAHLIPEAEKDYEGALAFLNSDVPRDQWLTKEDLSDPHKVSQRLLSKEDYQRLYRTQVKHTASYKKVALSRIFNAYKKLGAINNVEAIQAIIPENLMMDPYISVKDVLMAIFLASDENGGFLKYIDENGEEKEIFNVHKILIGDQEKGESKEQLEKRVEQYTKRNISEMTGLAAKYNQLQTATHNLTAVSADIEAHAVEIKNIIKSEFPELEKSLKAVIDFEATHILSMPEHEKREKVNISSKYQAELKITQDKLKKSESSADLSRLENLNGNIKRLDALLLQFINARESYINKMSILENALIRVNINPADYMAGKYNSQLADNNWVREKALEAAQYEVIDRMTNDILTGFIPLPLNERRFFVLENDGNPNRKLQEKTINEAYRVFVYKNFGKNFAYNGEANVTLNNGVNQVTQSFSTPTHETFRSKLSEQSMPELIEMINGAEYETELRELARREAESILGYGAVDPREHAQRIGFDRRAEWHANLYVLKIYKDAGFGLPSHVQQFVANAEESGRDYVHMTPDELRSKYGSLTDDKKSAAANLANTFEKMDQTYEKMKKKQIDSLQLKCEKILLNN
ncbi:MAG: hypothetical protein ACXVCY_14110 [Pseudobdellovibrionaceae bacterium]